MLIVQQTNSSSHTRGFVKMTRKGGKIGLSGILAGKQAEEVIEKYSSEGCAEFEVYEKDEWVCIECTVL